MKLRRYSPSLVRRARYLYGWVFTNPDEGYYIQLVKSNFLLVVPKVEVTDNKFRLYYVRYDEHVYVGDELLDGPFDLYIG